MQQRLIFQMLRRIRAHHNHFRQWCRGHGQGGMLRHGQSLPMPEGFEYDVNDENSCAGVDPVSGGRNKA